MFFVSFPKSLKIEKKCIYFSAKTIFIERMMTTCFENWRSGCWERLRISKWSCVNRKNTWQRFVATHRSKRKQKSETGRCPPSILLIVHKSLRTLRRKKKKRERKKKMIEDWWCNSGYSKMSKSLTTTFEYSISEWCSFDNLVELHEFVKKK